MASIDATKYQILRIVDVNLNRIGDGLRFLENLARLLLNDTILSEQLKTMRHTTSRVPGGSIPTNSSRI